MSMALYWYWARGHYCNSYHFMGINPQEALHLTVIPCLTRFKIRDIHQKIFWKNSKRHGTLKHRVGWLAWLKLVKTSKIIKSGSDDCPRNDYTRQRWTDEHFFFCFHTWKFNLRLFPCSSRIYWKTQYQLFSLFQHKMPFKLLLSNYFKEKQWQRNVAKIYSTFSNIILIKLAIYVVRYEWRTSFLRQAREGILIMQSHGRLLPLYWTVASIIPQTEIIL